MNDSTFAAPVFLGILIVVIWLAIFFTPTSSPVPRRRAKPLVFPPVDSFPLGIAVRPYRVEDQPACLAIYESNADFLPPMPEMVVQTIEKHPEGCLVAELHGKIVAFGGVTMVPEQRFALFWMGLVYHEHHHQGIGTLMLLVRLALVEGMALAVSLETTIKTESFYERFDFHRYSEPEKRYLGEHSHFYMRRFSPEEQGKPICAYLRKTNVTFAFDFDKVDLLPPSK